MSFPTPPMKRRQQHANSKKDRMLASADRLWLGTSRAPVNVPVEFDPSDLSLHQIHLIFLAASTLQPFIVRQFDNWKLSSQRGGTTRGGRRRGGGGRHETKPPMATLATALSITVPMLVQRNFLDDALNPHAVLRGGGQLRRLISCHLMHTSWEQWIMSLANIVTTGEMLEKRRGTETLVKDVAICALTSASLTVGGAAIAHKLGVLSSDTYFFDGCCGAGMIADSMEAVLGEEMAGMQTTMRMYFFLPVKVPIEYTPWVKLIMEDVMRYLIMPPTWASVGGGVSLVFVSRIAGISAGILRVHARPVLIHLCAKLAGLRSSASGARWSGRGQPRRLNEGSRRQRAAPSRGGRQPARGGGVPLSAPTRRFLMHGAYLCGAIAVHVCLASRSAARVRQRIVRDSLSQVFK